jgi:hypothetical protein
MKGSSSCRAGDSRAEEGTPGDAQRGVQAVLGPRECTRALFPDRQMPLPDVRPGGRRGSAERWIDEFSLLATSQAP